MEKEIPGTLRPIGGTKKFRRNCRLVVERDAIAVTDREGTTTRFRLDGSDDAPKEMMTYIHEDPFVILDGKGRGVISNPYVLWDAHECADFCERAHLENSVTNTYRPSQLRPDGVSLEEPVWMRRYVVSAPYILVAGVVLAPLGRAFDLSVWLMLPFLPWFLMYFVVRAAGYFMPRRLGPAEVAFNEKAAEQAEQEVRKRRNRKASAP